MKTLINKSDLTEIIERMQAVQSDSQGLWGNMTAGLMLNHCADQMRVCMGLLQAKPQSGAFLQGIIKWVFLRLPIQFPKNLKTFKEIEPDLKQKISDSDFEKAKLNLIGLLEDFGNSPIDCTFKHPIFGVMTRQEMGKLTYTHFDHHLRQFDV
jgi:hypothetical protein